MSERSLLDHIWRYGVVGISNTGLGLAVILTVEFGLKAPALVANACGYAAGFALGFLLNRSFVFRSQGDVARTGPRYLVAVVVAYGMNLIVLQSARTLLPGGALAHAAAQVAAMVAYTVLLFLLSRYWVFAMDKTR